MNNKIILIALLALTNFPSIASTKFNQSESWKDFTVLADYIEDKGKRTAGAPQEKQMADWITQQWQDSGYDVARLPFEFTLKMTELNSQNLSITLPGESKSVVVVGAHYDSVGDHNGSLGLIDNGSGVSALLTLAKQLKGKTLPYTVRFVAFGAEERGLKGSKAYIQQGLKGHQDIQLNNVVAMINLDTIIGGDKLYVHSAHSTPYKCDAIGQQNYSSSSTVRDGLKSVSDSTYKDSPHLLHAAFKGYPEGETGSWSDHSPFACAGIPIAYIEATNFALEGKRGNDGYSQVADKAYWTCLDDTKLAACDRSKEKAWGEIWHTKFDRADALFPVMKDRLKAQMEQNVVVLRTFLLSADRYISQSK